MLRKKFWNKIIFLSILSGSSSIVVFYSFIKLLHPIPFTEKYEFSIVYTISSFAFIFSFYNLFKSLYRLVIFFKWLREMDIEKEIPRAILSVKDDLRETAILLLNKMKEQKDLVKEKTLLEESKTTFLSRISHEFLSPVAVIKGYANLLIKREDDLKKLDYIEKILKSTTHLETLISDLISSSKFSAYTHTYNFDHIDIQELLFDVYEEFLPIAQEKGLNFVLRLPEYPSVVIADPQALKTAVTNLVSNAIKYTREGKIILEGKKEGSSIKISVTDTGPGISQEEIKLIFKPYYQGKISRTKEVGMGLGLSIVKDIIEAHGSKIEVKSELGKGSTFYFYLKLV